MLRYFSGLIILVLLTGCHSQEIDPIVETVEGSLDVMAFEIYQDKLYMGTADGLYAMDEYERIIPIKLIHDLSIIRDLQVDKENRLWVGGVGGIIVIHEDGSQHYYGDELLPDLRVNVIKSIDNNHMVIGTWDGVIEIDNKMESVYNPAFEQVHSPMVYVYENLPNGSQFFGSYNVRNGGVTIVDEDYVQVYDNDSDIASINSMTSLVKEDVLLVGGGMYESGGLSRFFYDGDRWKLTDTFHLKDGLAGEKVRSLNFIDGLVYLGSEYDGLAIWKMDKNLQLIKEQAILSKGSGLPNLEVKCIIKYNDLIYIGTKTGIGKLSQIPTQ